MSSASHQTSKAREVGAYVVTFNCARQLIDVDFFATHLLDGLPATEPRPELVVLSLQEVAPIAYSFLGSSSISQYVHRFEIAVKQAFEDRFGADAADDISLLAADNVGMTAVLVFARGAIRSDIRGVQTGGTGTGLWEMGNKGGVGIRLWLASEDDELVPISFIAAHLAPMESAWQRRNEDWRSICERLVFTSIQAPARTSFDSSSEPLLQARASVGEGRMLVGGTNLLFAGDLNYRTSDIKPHPEDQKAWPSPLQHPSSSQLFSALFDQDQLNRERNAGKTLHQLDEAKIDFPPSYKYSDFARDNAYAIAKNADVAEYNAQQIWAGHRFPAWCDRILFQSGMDVKTLAYTALPIQPTSDHRPVALMVKLQLRAPGTESTSSFPLDKAWRSKRAQARRLEFVVGLAAYLSLTWEGRAILTGTVFGIVGSILALRSLLGT